MPSELEYHIRESHNPEDLGIVCPNNKSHSIEWSLTSIYMCICQECGLNFTHDKIKNEK